MKKLALFTAFALVLGMSSGAFANNINNPNSYQEVITVFNNSGSTLSSGAVVVFDTSGTGVSAGSTLGGYVTTTTSADNDLVAGVVLSNSITDQRRGSIVVHGPALTNFANATDGTATAGTPVGTTTVAGQAGNAGSDAATLGTALETDSNHQGDYDRVWIYVDPARIN